MPVLPDRRRLRSMIGGRWAISLAGYLVLAPLGAVWIFTTIPEAFFRADGWLLGVVAAITSYLITGGILWIASVTFFRNRREHPVPIAAVIAIGAISWGARSGYLAWFIAALDLPSEATPVTRIVSGAAAGAIIVPASAWILASLDVVASTRRRLLDELVAAEVSAEQSATYLEAMREGVVTEVRGRIDREFDRAQEQDVAAAIAIDQLADRMARDLPRELWSQARRDSSLTTSLVLHTAARRPLTGWPLVPLGVLGTITFIRFLPLGATVISLLAAMVWAFGVTILINRWAANSSSLAPLIVGTLGIAMSGGVFAITLSFAAPTVSVSPAYAILVAVTFVVFIVGSALAYAINIAEKSVVARLRESIGNAEVHAEMLVSEEARVRREIATTLHGTVGASLTAAAMRLRSAIGDGDANEAIDALHEARRLVHVEMSAIALDETSDLSSLIDQIAEAWSGLVSIRKSVNVDSPMSSATMRALDNVITEGVNNAVRHARAKNLDIRVRQSPTHLHVEVIDDGHRSDASTPGLGSSILNRVAPNSWALTSTPHGSTLTVDIPT